MPTTLTQDENVYLGMVSDTMVEFMKTLDDLCDEAKEDMISIITDAIETDIYNDRENKNKINQRVHEVSRKYDIPILNIFSVISTVLTVCESEAFAEQVYENVMH